MGIGKRIREARRNKGLTQEELAMMIGVTKGAVANYENETSHPKEPIMYALFDTLDVEPNFLFQDCVNLLQKKSPGTTEAASGEDPEVNSLRTTLLYNFDQLNQEGQERLVETSDDMVSSGKYIKSVSTGLGEEA